MKRVLQVVAVVVIAVLAAQPAVAGMTCGMLTVANVNCGHGASLCGMAMSQMGMDCPMPEHVAGTGCLQECCQHGFPQGVVQAASGVKPKAGGTELFMVLPAMTPAPSLSFAAPPPDSIVASAPPRYILLQVFRI